MQFDPLTASLLGSSFTQLLDDILMVAKSEPNRGDPDASEDGPTLDVAPPEADAPPRGGLDVQSRTREPVRERPAPREPERASARPVESTEAPGVRKVQSADREGAGETMSSAQSAESTHEIATGVLVPSGELNPVVGTESEWSGSAVPTRTPTPEFTGGPTLPTKGPDGQDSAADVEIGFSEKMKGILRQDAQSPAPPAVAKSISTASGLPEAGSEVSVAATDATRTGLPPVESIQVDVSGKDATAGKSTSDGPSVPEVPPAPPASSGSTTGEKGADTGGAGTSGSPANVIAVGATTTTSAESAAASGTATQGSTGAGSIEGVGSSRPMELAQAARARFQLPSESRGKEMVDRIVQATRMSVRNGRAEVRILLHPPDLGRLRIEMSVKDGVLSAQLRTESVAAKTAIQANLAQLRETLDAQGIHVGQFEVTVQQGTAGQPHMFGGQSFAESNFAAPAHRVHREDSADMETVGSVGKMTLVDLVA